MLRHVLVALIVAVWPVLTSSGVCLAEEADNQSSGKEVQVLIEQLNNDSPAVRAMAAEQLGKLGPQASAAVPALCRILKEKPVFHIESGDGSWLSPAVAAAGALGRIQDRDALPALVRVLEVPAERQQVNLRGYPLPNLAVVAVRSIGQIGEPATGPLLMQLFLRSNYQPFRQAATEALAELGEPAVSMAMTGLFSDNAETSEKHVSLLAGMQRHQNFDGYIGGVLDWAFKDERDQVRRNAVKLLARCPRLRNERWNEHLVICTNDPDPVVRSDAVEALATDGNHSVVDTLIARLNDSDQFVCKAANRSLTTITGKHFGEDADEWENWWRESRPVDRGNQATPTVSDGKPRYQGAIQQADADRTLIDIGSNEGVSPADFMVVVRTGNPVALIVAQMVAPNSAQVTLIQPQDAALRPGDKVKSLRLVKESEPNRQ